MRRRIIITSVFAAAFAAAGFVDHEMWIPALICLAWEILVLYASTRKKPRVATRSSENKSSTKILDFYSTTTTITMQSKTWTPAGKALTVINFEE